MHKDKKPLPAGLVIEHRVHGMIIAVSKESETAYRIHIQQGGEKFTSPMMNKEEIFKLKLSFSAFGL